MSLLARAPIVRQGILRSRIVPSRNVHIENTVGNVRDYREKAQGVMTLNNFSEHAVLIQQRENFRGQGNIPYPLSFL